jgi:hypothetical protein
VNKLPMAIPFCPYSRDHGRTELRPLARQTPEQKFCGTWYDCPKCHSSVLFPSKELTDFLEQFKKPVVNNK